MSCRALSFGGTWRDILRKKALIMNAYSLHISRNLVHGIELGEMFAASTIVLRRNLSYDEYFFTGIGKLIALRVRKSLEVGRLKEAISL